MQAKVISLTDRAPYTLTAQIGRIRPGTPLEVQRGVDLRRVPVDTLLHQGFLTHSAAWSIKHGRRWHHELSSTGALGLAHAVRLALEDDPTRPLLLMEDDCHITDETRFREDLDTLLLNTDAFDLAVFGLRDKSGTATRPVSVLPPGWYHVDDQFFFTHCVLFSPRGRVTAAEHLRQSLDMQIDSLYASLAGIGELRIWGQVRNRTAVQSAHVSSLQEFGGGCLLCDGVRSPVVIAAIAAAAVLIAYCCHVHRSTEDRTRAL